MADETLEQAPRAGGESGSFAVGIQAAGRYRIERFVASGGMGEVYAAHDLVLDTAIALKTLRADREQSSEAIERLRREIALARNVTNPHVCRLHDVGEHAGRVFLTMELLDGRTLAELIRDSALPIEDVERLAGQLVDGLAALHRAGIIHRDFKSANVIVTGDGEARRAVITDFGLARAVDGDDARLTLEASLLGTPAYMAPEQVEARPATKASDVYALGVVLFEMLTGTLPFQGDTPMTIAMARLHADPPRPSSLRAGVPGRWDAIVLGCLAREPERRPARIEDVLAIEPRSRRWFLAASGGALALGALGAWRLLGATDRPLATTGPVAVLPVAGPGSYLDDPWRIAITVDLYDALGATVLVLMPPYGEGQFVSLDPAFAGLADEPDPLAAVAIRGVRATIAVAMARDAAGITLRLTGRGEGIDGWEYAVSRPAAEVAAVVADAATAIALATGARPPRVAADGASLTAALYERYGQALSWLFREKSEDERAAIRAQQLPDPMTPLRQLVAEQPRLSRASARLGEYLVMLAEQEEGAEAPPMLAMVRGLAEAALAGDPACALAYAIRGHVAMLEWNWPAADADTGRAIELAPNHVRVTYHRQILAMMLGRFDEALARIDRKLRAPDGSEANKAWYYFYARRWPDVVRVVEPTIDRSRPLGESAADSGSKLFQALMLALAYAEMTRTAEANALADRIRAAKPDNYLLSSLVTVYAMTGRTADAQTIRDQIGDQTDLGAQALMDDAVGEFEAALGKLERIVASHNVHALFLRIDRYSAPLRSHARFQKLLQTVFGDYV